MALVKLEGFDAYTDFHGQFEGKWSNASSGISLITGRQDIGKAVRFASGKSITGDTPNTFTLILGFAIFVFDTFSTINTNTRILTFGGPSNPFNTGEIAHLDINNAGELLLFQSNPFGSNLRAVSTDFISTDRWHYIELKITAGNPGSVAFQIDGAPAGSESGINLDPHEGDGMISLYRLHASTGTDLAYDDHYIATTEGPRNNDFIGDSKILTTFPNADTAQKDFTPSDSAEDNFEMVNDEGPDGDDTFNHSEVAGAVDMFETQLLDIKPGDIHGVAVNTRARKTDTATRLITPLVESNGSKGVATGQSVATTYRTRQQIYELDPDGDAEWTPAKVNASLIGYQGD